MTRKRKKKLKDKRRRRSVTSVLLSDFWRKLTALLLAFVLWYYLDSQVITETNLSLLLRQVSTAADVELSDPKVLQIRIDTTNYSIGRFEDVTTGASIRSVDLMFRGARHLISILGDNPGFTLTPSLAPGETSFEFDKDDIRVLQPRFQGLIAAMIPRTVRVDLERNAQRRVLIEKDRILVTPPEGSSDFVARLMWDEADYTEDSVMLIGTEVEVNKVASQEHVFRFAPPAPPPGNNPKVRGTLTLIDPTGRVSMEPREVSLMMPMRIEPKEFTFESVIVVLSGPLKERFRPRDPTMKVTIQASKSLEVVLSGMNQDELKQWGENRCVLVATPPPDYQAGSTLTPSFIITGQEFFEPRDFKVVIRPPVILDPKQE